METLTVDIQYDRSARQYVWCDPDSGELFTFPAKAKGEAFQFAVSMLDPELFATAQRAIARNPHLERTVWRAVEIVVSNGVELHYDGRLVAMVNSSDGMGRYAVENDNGYHTCQCESFTGMTAPITHSGARYCKHIVAALIERTRESRF